MTFIRSIDTLRAYWAATWLSVVGWFGARGVLRTDTSGEISVGHWVGLVIGIIVLVIVLAKLFPTLTQNLSSYSNADTSGFGAVLKTLVPILIGAGVLLALVAALIHYNGNQ